MVRQYCNLEITIFRKSFHQRSKDKFIYSFNSLDLLIKVASMSCFIRSFHMDNYQVIVLQCIHSIFALGLVVCIKESGSSRNIYICTSSAYPQSLNQVNTCNYRTFQSISIFHVRHVRHGSLTPEPNHVARLLAICNSLLVYRMVFQGFF